LVRLPLHRVYEGTFGRSLQLYPCPERLAGGGGEPVRGGHIEEKAVPLQLHPAVDVAFAWDLLSGLRIDLRKVKAFSRALNHAGSPSTR